MLTTHEANHEMLPAYCQARVVILGVGNILFGDDGFGPEVINYLTNHYAIPEDTYVMDVGTGVRKLLFTITLSDSKPEEIVVVDAVDWGQDIGSLSLMSAGDLPASKVDDFSLHQLPTSNLLRELQEDCGVKVTVVACDVSVMPGNIQPGLSSVVQKAVIAAAQLIAGRYFE